MCTLCLTGVDWLVCSPTPVLVVHVCPPMYSHCVCVRMCVHKRVCVVYVFAYMCTCVLCVLCVLCVRVCTCVCMYASTVVCVGVVFD